jgi:16S rRNA (adenine1518-N6/adenine1519-N6)-dimethyltransferase
MVDPSIFELMGDYASLCKEDVLLDIGAGLGFLTRFLAKECKEVLAVEADPQLITVLRDSLRNLPNVRIISGNALKTQLPPFNKVVSIPPYQISSKLVYWLLRLNLDCVVLILQREFANRLIAPIGSEYYGWLTVLTYYHASAELLDPISKTRFYPQPEVDSIIVRLKRKQSQPFCINNESFFHQILRSLFTQRNRKVRNAIVPIIKSNRSIDAEKAAKMVEAIPFRDRRVRELAPEDFGVLANAICN